MDTRSCRKWQTLLVLPILCVWALPPAIAQTPLASQPSPATNYVVGAQDMLTITSYDQADLSGKFTVEADGTFPYPMIGRVKAGGMTLRQVEAQVKKQLKDEGFFNNPQITVSIDQYRSQKIFVVGEVRTPGPYPLSGDMNLIEALARPGTTLPTPRSDAVPIHPTSAHVTGPLLPSQEAAPISARLYSSALE